MLGDWVQDYPGDLSGPDSFPLLNASFTRLLQHPSTVHNAASLQPFVDAVQYASDLDLSWSRSAESDSAHSVAAAIPPGRRPLLLNHRSSEAQSSLNLGSLVPSSPVPSLVSSPMPTAAGLHDELHSQDTAFQFEHESASGSRVSRHQPVGNRDRSASDLPSSTEGSSPSTQTGVSPHPGVSPVPSPVPQVAPPSTAKQLDAQKIGLRSVSNALGLVSDTQIAAELTRLEWIFFSAIGPRDILRHILVPREQREPNGPVAKSIAHFNYISSWVGSMILIQSKAKQRARVLEKFMSIASILRKDNNYNTLQSVLAGLGNTSVHRLAQTHELVANKPVHKVYQSLTRLMKSDRSFAAYRLALENSGERTIPFL